MRRRVKENINYLKIENVVLICANIFLIFITFGEFIFNTHYSSDDFYCIYNQKGEAIAVTYQSYRAILGTIYYLLDIVGINVVNCQKSMGVLMLILFAFATSLITIIFYNLVKKKIKDWRIIILINLGSLLLIINVFVSEWIWFSLAYIQWGISVLFAILAIYFFSKEFSRLKNCFWAFVCLTIAAGCYQVVIAIYAFFIMTYIYLKWNCKITMKVLYDVFIAAFIAAMAILINIILSKGLGYINGMNHVGSRMEITNIFGKVLMIFKNEKLVWKNAVGMMPSFFLVSVGIVYVGIIIYSYVIGNYRFLDFLWIGVIMISGNVVRWLLVLAQGEFWQPARILVPFMCIFAVFNIITIYYSNGNKKILMLDIIIVCLLLLCNFVEIQRNKFDCIKTNSIQENEMRTIAMYIKEYEEENNISINYVSVIRDENPTYKYLDILNNTSYNGEMATRSLVTTWSDGEMVKHYLEKEIEEIETNGKEKLNLFEKENYDYFSVEEQVKFIGDTVYICAY